MLIHGKEYTEVKDRIPELLESYPEAQITTEVFWHSNDFTMVVMKATAKVGNRLFTGWAYEERVADPKQVNETSWVENCETSAIGRALANMNIGVRGGQRPSAEEMQKVGRMKGVRKADVTTEGETVAKAEAVIRKATTTDELKKCRQRLMQLCDAGELTEGAFKLLTSLINERGEKLSG